MEPKSGSAGGEGEGQGGREGEREGGREVRIRETTINRYTRGLILPLRGLHQPQPLPAVSSAVAISPTSTLLPCWHVCVTIRERFWYVVHAVS